MPKVTPNDIRHQILKDRGITSFKTKKKQRRLQPVPKPTINPKLRTPLMRYFEAVKGQPIETILLGGSLSYIAHELDDEVDVTTISKWIKRLRLRYSIDNLPQCEGCAKRGPACQDSVCYILAELGLYDLLLLKRKEIMEDA